MQDKQIFNFRWAIQDFQQALTQEMNSHVAVQVKCTEGTLF